MLSDKHKPIHIELSSVNTSLESSNMKLLTDLDCFILKLY